MRATKTMRGVVVATRRRVSTKNDATLAPGPFEYCTQIVKKGDYDGYLYSLLQGSERSHKWKTSPTDPTSRRRRHGDLSDTVIHETSRHAAMAIRAFNVETATIKDVVRGNVVPGRMRMQWWKDSLADIFAGDPPPQPVALALSHVVSKQHIAAGEGGGDYRGGLTRRWFDRVVDARMADLDSSQPHTVNEMETYAEYTASSLLYLSLEIAGVRAWTEGQEGTNAPIVGINEIGHAASHVGKATGMCTLLRSIALPKVPQSALAEGPMDACILPTEVMRKNSLSHGVLQRGPKTEKEAHALAESVFDVATVAKGHMDLAVEGLAAASDKRGGQGLPAGAFAALLPGVRAMWYLEKLEECQFDAFDETLRPRSPLAFQLRLAKAVWREQF